MIHAILEHPFISKEFRRRYGLPGLLGAIAVHLIIYVVAVQWMGGFNTVNMSLAVIASFVFGGMISDLLADLWSLVVWFSKGKTGFPWPWVFITPSLLFLGWMGIGIDQGRYESLQIHRDLGLYLMFIFFGGAYAFHKSFVLLTEKKISMREGINQSLQE